jgi:diguanylate cyclase (GGDEF)-like protein
MTTAQKRVLVVDDDRLMREMLADALRMDGVEVRTAASGAEALGILAAEAIDVVIADLVMPGMGGLDVLERLTRRRPHPAVIIVTGYGTVESAVRSLRLGAADYLQKPVNPEALQRAVLRAFESMRLLNADHEIRRHVDLYEGCRRLLFAVERGTLFEQALATLLAATEGTSGLALLWEWGKREVEIAAKQGLSEEHALDLGRRIEELVVQGGPEGPSVASLDDEALLLVPLSRDEAASAVLAVAKPGEAGFRPRDLRNAAFLADHLSYALPAALRAADAHDQAFIDQLTGLYNARYFDVVLNRELTRAQVDGAHGRTFSVLMLDIDQLKATNDRFGPAVGSKVLVEVGRVLRRCVREVDPVFRYGGDEYTLMLRGADAQGALHVAERIRRSIEAHPFLAREGLELRLTASIGVASFPEHAATKERLVDLADAALLRAKRGMRNSVVVAQPAAVP